MTHPYNNSLFNCQEWAQGVYSKCQSNVISQIMQALSKVYNCNSPHSKDPELNSSDKIKLSQTKIQVTKSIQCLWFQGYTTRG